MKPEDFKGKEPRLIIENYLSGNVKAWGVLQNRSGKVTRQFSADLDGKWDGKQLILDEKFNWDDGEVQTRQWQITKIDDNNYEGTAGDVVGKARGYSYGPAFKFEYVLLVPVKGKEIKITFDDWIFKQDNGKLPKLMKIIMKEQPVMSLVKQRVIHMVQLSNLSMFY